MFLMMNYKQKLAKWYSLDLDTKERYWKAMQSTNPEPSELYQDSSEESKRISEIPQNRLFSNTSHSLQNSSYTSEIHLESVEPLLHSSSTPEYTIQDQDFPSKPTLPEPALKIFLDTLSNSPDDLCSLWFSKFDYFQKSLVLNSLGELPVPLQQSQASQLHKLLLVPMPVASQVKLFLAQYYTHSCKWLEEMEEKEEKEFSRIVEQSYSESMYLKAKIRALPDPLYEEDEELLLYIKYLHRKNNEFRSMNEETIEFLKMKVMNPFKPIK